MQYGIMEVLRQGLNPFLAMSDTWITVIGSWAGVFQVSVERSLLALSICLTPIREKAEGFEVGLCCRRVFFFFFFFRCTLSMSRINQIKNILNADGRM